MMISLRSAAGIATIWVVAVAGVSGTAWFAIDRAGRDITTADVNSLAPPGLSTPTPLQPTVTESPSAVTQTPAPSVAAPPGAVSTPSTTPRSRHPSGSSATAPTPTPQVRTASFPGGQVTARCDGSQIQLQVAQPENEWRVHVEDTQPGRVVVSFTMGDEEESHRTQVTATCGQGTPDFNVRT